MKKFIPVTLSFLFISLASAQSNFEQSWKGVRYQGTLGTCHIFAATALLEAEWANDFKEKRDFLEGYLSVRHILGKDEKEGETSLNLHYQLNTQSTVNWLKFKQAGWISESFKLAKEVGVIDEKEAPYKEVETTFVDLDWQLSQGKGKDKEGRFYEKLNETIYRWYANWRGRHHEWLQGLDYKKHEFPALPRTELMKILKEKITCRPVGLEAKGSIWGVEGFHAVVVAGYNPKDKKFIIRNSWGRASLFKKHEQVSEDLIAEHIRSIGYIQNSGRECFDQEKTIR